MVDIESVEGRVSKKNSPKKAFVLSPCYPIALSATAMVGMLVGQALRASSDGDLTIAIGVICIVGIWALCFYGVANRKKITNKS